MTDEGKKREAEREKREKRVGEIQKSEKRTESAKKLTGRKKGDHVSERVLCARERTRKCKGVLTA